MKANKKRLQISLLVTGIVLFVAIFTGAGPLSSAWADDIEARAIMEKVDARDDGDNALADMEMILIDKKGKKRIRKILSYSKDKGKDTYRIMFFVHPANVKDTGFLTYDYEDINKDDDQWLYLPALKKTKRIASSDKDSAFMGSDFSYADMTDRNIDEYNFKILKETKVNDVKAWVIESIPKTDKIIDTYGYTKSVIYVRQDNYVVIRVVNWVKKGEKLKYMNVKKLELIDNIWVPLEIHMTTKKGKLFLHKTILKRANVKYNQDLEEGLFTVRRLEKGP